MAAWTTLYSGSATIGTTEYSLSLSSTTGAPASKTDNGSIWCFVDLTNLAAGDQFELRCYEKCRSGDTQRLFEAWLFTTGSKSLEATPPLPLANGWDFTLKKIAGTDRAIAYSLRAYQ